MTIPSFDMDSLVEHLFAHLQSLRHLCRSVVRGATVSKAAEDVFRADADLTAAITRGHRNWERLSDWEKVNIIRHWAAQHIVWSSDSCLLENDISFSLYTQIALAIFNAFLGNKGGVKCGGASYALMRLYEVLGYESHLVNMGKPEHETHVVTLVYIEDHGESVLSIQDPLFDISYTTCDGRPIDYFKMLARLRDRNHSQIKVVPSNEWKIKRNIIIEATERDNYSWIETSRKIIPLEGNRRLYKATMSFSLYDKVNQKAAKFKEFLLHAGYPRNFLYVYLFPFQVDYCTLEKLAAGSGCKDEESSILRRALEVAARTSSDWVI